MMKKMLSILLALAMLLLPGGAFADESVEDKVAATVKSVLDTNGLAYEYDEENGWIDFQCDLEGKLGIVDVTVFLYDDMISVVAYSPFSYMDYQFENAAIFTTLVNSDIYYAHFIVNRDLGQITCRSCNVIESVLPSEDEIMTLIYMPLVYMMSYGEGLSIISESGTDPYEAYNACIVETEDD